MRRQERDTWEQVRSHDELCVATLTDMGIPTQTGRGYINRWVRDAKITLVRKERNGTLVYTPVAPGSVRKGGAALVRSAENSMWTAMRGLRTFSARDVAAHASSSQLTVSEKAAQIYCSHLLAAGYLKALQTAVPGHRKATYRMIRNTGPIGPRLRRVTALADPNIETLTIHEEAKIWQQF